MGSSKSEFESSVKLVAKSSVVVFVGFILSKIFTYGTKVIIARNFGPEQYGLFSLATFILLFFVYLFSLGLPEGILRYSSFYLGKSETSKIKFILVSSAIVLFFLSIFAGLALFLLSKTIAIHVFESESLIIFLKWFSLLVPFYIGLNIFLSLLRAYQLMSSYSFVLNILQPGINLMGLVILAYFGLKDNSIVFSYIISIVLSFVVALIICNYLIFRNLRKIPIKNLQKKPILSELFSYSWPLLFSTVLANIFTWTDSFMIGYYKNVADVGYYNVAVAISNIFTLVPAIFVSVFFPLIVKEFSNDKIELVRDLSKQVSKWILIINLPVLALFLIFPDVAVRLLFGQNYLSAQTSLAILSVGVMTISVLTISRDLLSMKGKSKVILVNTILLFLINVFLNAKLIPLYGLNGAAIATSASLILTGVVITVESKHYLSFVPVSKKFLKLSPFSIPVVLLYLIKKAVVMSLTGVILSSFILILIYAVLVISSGFLDTNDIMLLKLLKNKISRKK